MSWKDYSKKPELGKPLRDSSESQDLSRGTYQVIDSDAAVSEGNDIIHKLDEVDLKDESDENGKSSSENQGSVIEHAFLMTLHKY